MAKPKKNPFSWVIASLPRHFPKPVPEYRFHHTRKWRFDYAWPEAKIALEYEGIFQRVNRETGEKNEHSRHTNVKGYSDDCVKYNEAAIAGWMVLRFTAKHLTLKNPVALDQIRAALKTYYTHL